MKNRLTQIEKMMSTLHTYKKQYRIYTKGALDQILKIANKVLINGEVVVLTDEVRQTYLEEASIMSSKALRVLGLAYMDGHRNGRSRKHGKRSHPSWIRWDD